LQIQGVQPGRAERTFHVSPPHLATEKIGASCKAQGARCKANDLLT
jgi:hypothetical protein